MTSITVDLDSATSGELANAAAVLAAELASRPAPESGAAAKDVAESLLRTLDLTESALARHIKRVTDTAEAARWGFASPTAWLRGQGMRPARAKERITLSRQLPRLSQTAERLATGTLPLGYASAICETVVRLNDRDTTAAEEILLRLADHHIPVGKVAATGTRIHELIAERTGQDADPESRRGYDRSWLATTKSLDGGKYLKGYLNPEDAAAWDGLIAPLAKPAGAEDRRDITERTAAALTTALTKGTTGTRALVVIEMSTLTGGDSPAHLPDGTRIPAARRIALNAGVSSLLLGPRGVPLYLGYRTRFATPNQRNVLTALYPTCAFHGCDIPGTLCEVDHINGWALGNSPTDIDLLALLCGWHNRWKHANPHRVRITRTPNRYEYHALPPSQRPAPHHSDRATHPTARATPHHLVHPTHASRPTTSPPPRPTNPATLTPSAHPADDRRELTQHTPDATYSSATHSYATHPYTTHPYTTHPPDHPGATPPHQPKPNPGLTRPPLPAPATQPLTRTSTPPTTPTALTPPAPITAQAAACAKSSMRATQPTHPRSLHTGHTANSDTKADRHHRPGAHKHSGPLHLDKLDHQTSWRP